jgi:hypothetical protein
VKASCLNASPASSIAYSRLLELVDGHHTVLASRQLRDETVRVDDFSSHGGR